VPQVRLLLERELPESYRGLPVRFPVTWDSSIIHKVEIRTVGGFAASRLGVDPTADLPVADWLILTGQSVLEVTAGPVFADRTAELAQVRARLNWYPPDIERYVLAAGLQRLSQEMPMVGRTAEHGDEIGSRLLSARLAGDLISLAFTLSRQWQPYPKWRGTAFRHSLSRRPHEADRAGTSRAAAGRVARGLGSPARQPGLRRPVPVPDQQGAQQAHARPGPGLHRCGDPAAAACHHHHRAGMGPGHRDPRHPAAKQGTGRLTESAAFKLTAGASPPRH
jgi:hypothetical protein